MLVFVVGEAAVTNLASVMSMLRNGCVTNGILPRAVYLEQTGWTDIVMTYLLLAHVPSLSEYTRRVPK